MHTPEITDLAKNESENFVDLVSRIFFCYNFRIEDPGKI